MAFEPGRSRREPPKTLRVGRLHEDPNNLSAVWRDERTTLWEPADDCRVIDGGVCP